MKKYVSPACPEQRKDCRFQSEPGMMTLMYSPLEYDRTGKITGGGSNKVTKCCRCNICGKRWDSTQTEREDAEGMPREWSLAP